MKTSLILSGSIAVAAWCCAPLHAAEMYRWVDAEGRTHIADVVPEAYRASAVKIDSKSFELTPAQRQEALAREHARAGAAAQVAADANKATKAPASGIGNSAAASAPAAAGDCTSRQSAYLSSQACFAPYRTANGAIKAEAFEHCTAVADPSPQCGLPKLD